jgi:glyoxylase-like metal-dependent hydrolase (beta-lactamase superfamily II)
MMGLYKMFKSVKMFAAVAALGMWATQSMAGDRLNVSVYNPGTKSMFPVTSTLITGPSEAILVDAQFQKNDAENLVKMIKNSGKKLTTVYVSFGDPDFYFGLETIKAAYPEVKIYASEKTLDKINHSYQGKLAFWGPKLGENAPSKVIIPELLPSDTLLVDGEELKIVGLKGHEPKRAYVWIPSIKTVIASISVFDKQHVWIADTQTAESRQQWMKTLDGIEALKATKIIPGHFVGDSKFTMDGVNFTRNYVKFFEESAVKSKTSVDLIALINAEYPNLAAQNILGLSAKVIMGEMKWGS